MNKPGKHTITLPLILTYALTPFARLAGTLFGLFSGLYWAAVKAWRFDRKARILSRIKTAKEKQ